MTAPVIHVQPSTQTVYEGQTCKFRVVAGGTSLTYQWQKSDDNGSNWSNVSGATSASYTTAATVRSTDNLDQYRCNVTSGGDTTTSDAAVMTVWNPSALGSDLALWLDPTYGLYQERTGASATTASANGGVVGTWRARNGTINGVAPADGQRPTYRATSMNGTPCVEFTAASSHYLNFTTDLAAVTNNKQYVYLFAGVAPTLSVSGMDVLVFSTNATSTRSGLAVNQGGTSGRVASVSRMTDGGAAVVVLRETAWAFDQEAFVLGGEMLYGTSDQYTRKNSVRVGTNTSAHTDGSTSATNSVAVHLGASTAGTGNYYGGYMSHVVAVTPSSALSTETIEHIENFIAYKSNVPKLDWNLNARVSGYTAATKTSPVRIRTPSGATVTEGDLTTHRYTHQNMTAYHNGRLHVAYSTGGADEDTGGQQIAWQYSDDLGATWSAATVILPSQSNFRTAGTPFENNTHVGFIRKWVKYRGDLYAVCAVERYGTGYLDSIGVMLCARKINEDGSVGTLFRVTPTDYTTLDSKTKIDYDATLGPALFDEADIYGVWGGSTPLNAASDHTGWVRQDAVDYNEFSTARGTDSVHRVLRDFTSNVPSVFFTQSTDDGATFGRIIRTNAPNGTEGASPYPSFVCFKELANGGYVLLGNTHRDRTELWVAYVDEDLKTQSVQTIVSGISNTAVYPATAKGGGCAYPSVVQIGNYLSVTWSERKEDIWNATVLIPSFSANGNYANVIEVTSPTLDDTRTAGSAANITATETGTSGTVDIKLSLDGGLTFPVTIASGQTLPYSWTPVYGHVTPTAVLRVIDAADSNVFGDSLEFEVVAASGGGGGGSAANLLLTGVG